MLHKAKHPPDTVYIDNNTDNYKRCNANVNKLLGSIQYSDKSIEFQLIAWGEWDGEWDEKGLTLMPHQGRSLSFMFFNLHVPI